jgi:periplasmic protein TonB
MNGFARVPTSPYLDEPNRRLVWTLPMALLVWLALLIGFSRMLELAAPPPRDVKPIEARLVELSPEVSGLQGGPPPAAAAKPQPALVKPVPIVRPHPVVHIHPRVKLKPVAPPVMPSETGTAKSEPAPPEASSGGAATATHGGGAGVPGGTGPSVGGSRLGSDTAGAGTLYAPVPEIPDELREEALDTFAIAHFKIGYDGNFEVTLAKPTSNPELNRILLDTLKQWRFFPAVSHGVAITSELVIRIPVTVQ